MTEVQRLEILREYFDNLEELNSTFSVMGIEALAVPTDYHLPVHADGRTQNWTKSHMVSKVTLFNRLKGALYWDHPEVHGSEGDLRSLMKYLTWCDSIGLMRSEVPETAQGFRQAFAYQDYARVLWCPGNIVWAPADNARLHPPNLQFDGVDREAYEIIERDKIQLSDLYQGFIDLLIQPSAAFDLMLAIMKNGAPRTGWRMTWRLDAADRYYITGVR